MTRLLLNEAEKKPLQYTFLTPQDTSEINQNKDLSILRFVFILHNSLIFFSNAYLVTQITRLSISIQTHFQTRESRSLSNEISVKHRNTYTIIVSSHNDSIDTFRFN